MELFQNGFFSLWGDISLIGQGQCFCISVGKLSQGLFPCFGLEFLGSEKWICELFGKFQFLSFPVLVQITKLSSSSPCRRRGLTSTSWWHRLSQRRMCKSWGHFTPWIPWVPSPNSAGNLVVPVSCRSCALCKHLRIVPPSWLNPGSLLTSKMFLFTLKMMGFWAWLPDQTQK